VEGFFLPLVWLYGCRNHFSQMVVWSTSTKISQVSGLRCLSVVHAL
jgi:hypothetical protein